MKQLPNIALCILSQKIEHLEIVISCSLIIFQVIIYYILITKSDTCIIYIRFVKYNLKILHCRHVLNCKFLK
jgi:hypothetical protein